MPDPQILQRGLEPYPQTFEAMRTFTDARDTRTSDQLWLVEHPPVFTLGLGADPAHIINAHDVPVVQTDRGGEVTYHGPGQAVVYLLFDLRREGRVCLPREFVRRIEQAVIDTLAAYNLSGCRKPGAPGIYISEGVWAGAKIAALGLKIRASGCTYHGVSLNVNMNLQAFSWIHPCGYPGLQTVDMRTLGVDIPLVEAQQALSLALIQQLRA
jgi:lipoyl(octanoyl) transferase